MEMVSKPCQVSFKKYLKKNVLAIYDKDDFLTQPYFNFGESKLLGHLGGSREDAIFTFF